MLKYQNRYWAIWYLADATPVDQFIVLPCCILWQPVQPAGHCDEYLRMVWESLHPSQKPCCTYSGCNRSWVLVDYFPLDVAALSIHIAVDSTRVQTEVQFVGLSDTKCVQSRTANTNRYTYANYGAKFMLSCQNKCQLSAHHICQEQLLYLLSLRTQFVRDIVCMWPLHLEQESGYRDQIFGRQLAGTRQLHASYWKWIIPTDQESLYVSDPAWSGIKHSREYAPIYVTKPCLAGVGVYKLRRANLSLRLRVLGLGLRDFGVICSSHIVHCGRIYVFQATLSIYSNVCKSYIDLHMVRTAWSSESPYVIRNT